LRNLARGRYHSDMENIEQLRHYLRDNGYSPFLTSNEVDRIAVLDWLIERTVTGWRVGFFERGQLTETVIDTDNERDAVQCFLRTVSAEIYHLKTFKDLDGVSTLEAALQVAEVPYQRSDVPHENLLRVFVSGPNLRQAQDVVARMVV
jgi:hypothetical protein